MSNSLYEDLVVEIFTRLPSKSLVRFRSLSKSWCSRIDSPSFRRSHALRSPQKLLFRHLLPNYDRFYTLHSEDQFPLCSIDCFPVVGFPVSGFDHIVGSCSGILCLCRSVDHEISLWNPSIRRKLTLPRHPLAWNARWGSSSIDSGVLLGFCFDPLADDYKIVTISYIYGTDIIDSYVYTMKTGKWCKIASPAIKLSWGALQGCLVNGTVHWLVNYFKNESDKIGHGFLITFDSSTNTFGTIALPEPGWVDTHLQVINGSLAVICVEGSDTFMWVRREHNNTPSWFIVSKMTTNGYLQFNPLCNSEFHVYNPQTRLQSGNMTFNGFLKLDMDMYGESLELLDTKNAYTSEGFRIYNKIQTWAESESVGREILESLGSGHFWQRNRTSEGKRRSKTASLRKMGKLFSSCLHL